MQLLPKIKTLKSYWPHNEDEINYDGIHLDKIKWCRFSPRFSPKKASLVSQKLSRSLLGADTVIPFHLFFVSTCDHYSNGWTNLISHDWAYSWGSGMCTLMTLGIHTRVTSPMVTVILLWCNPHRFWSLKFFGKFLLRIITFLAEYNLCQELSCDRSSLL